MTQKSFTQNLNRFLELLSIDRNGNDIVFVRDITTSVVISVEYSPSQFAYGITYELECRDWHTRIRDTFNSWARFYNREPSYIVVTRHKEQIDMALCSVSEELKKVYSEMWDQCGADYTGFRSGGKIDSDTPVPPVVRNDAFHGILYDLSQKLQTA